MKIKRTKLTIFVLVMSIILLFGTIGNVIIMNTVEELSEKNTTEFIATVKKVEIEGEEINKHAIIYTQEYGDKLSTFNIKEIIDIHDLNGLKTGQKIAFRTMNIWINEFEEMNVIPIFSIRTEGNEIASLSSYNEYMAYLLPAPTIAGIAVGSILLFISLHCILLLKGVNIFRRRK